MRKSGFFSSFYYKRHWKAFVISLSVVVVFFGGLSVYFRLPPINFVKNGLRVVAVPILAHVYDEDVQDAEQIRREYLVGERHLTQSSALKSWKNLESNVTGFHVLSVTPEIPGFQEIPFVYESMNAPHLVAFRERYKLNELIAGAADEYEAMLRLGGWVGSQWDHGLDAIPGGNTLCFNPIAVVEAGRAGAKFWCEIAAKVTVHAATALGWEARLVTGSRNGYDWEHALAELWSNQYNKWFVIDADFNVVYETTDGVPLSAFELCHDWPELEKAGKLTVRRIAPAKPSLPLIDLLPFYRYVHIDLRNDWNSRQLRRGSPAGGDLATWWTARPDFGPLLTSKIRVDDRHRFNWPVNKVEIHVKEVEIHTRHLENRSEQWLRFGLSLVAYSPNFQAFEVSFDGKSWDKTVSGKYSLPCFQGEHTIKVRVVTASNQKGPVSEVRFQIL